MGMKGRRSAPKARRPMVGGNVGLEFGLDALRR